MAPSRQSIEHLTEKLDAISIGGSTTKHHIPVFNRRSIAVSKPALSLQSDAILGNFLANDQLKASDSAFLLDYVSIPSSRDLVGSLSKLSLKEEKKGHGRTIEELWTKYEMKLRQNRERARAAMHYRRWMRIRDHSLYNLQHRMLRQALDKVADDQAVPASGASPTEMMPRSEHPKG